MKYLTQEAESSFCPDCDRRVTLLCEENGDGPQFYICFPCRFVAHIGEARLDVAEPDVVASYPEHVDRGWLMQILGCRTLYGGPHPPVEEQKLRRCPHCGERRPKDPCPHCGRP